jgi:hypothetical protein
MKDVISFGDFIANNAIKESIKDKNIDIETINISPEPKKETELVYDEPTNDINDSNMDFDIEDFVIEEEVDDTNFYKLYKDINEEFICDITIKGSTPDETFARIIIESEEWSLIFPGTIKNGKCIVPIRKLGIFKEGQVGNIKLEVVAEGNLFVPWEDTYKVKLSKDVVVNVNENKIIKDTKDYDVKVNVNK